MDADTTTTTTTDTTTTADAPAVPATPHHRLAISCTKDGAFSRRIRTAIADHCDGRADAATIADAQLIASELVTNAFEHGNRRGVVTIDVVVENATLTLTVTSTGSGAAIPHPSLWLLPEASEMCGRGLALTRKVSNTVELHATVAADHADWTAISANMGPGASAA